MIPNSFRCCAILILLSSYGCSSIVNSHKQKMDMMAAYIAGDGQEALKLCDRKLESVKGSGDEIAWLLEAGYLNFISKNYPNSIKRFTRAEELIKEYDERAVVSMRDISAEGAVAVTNLNALPYRGWCRDRIMLSVMKAFDYLGEGRESAFRAQVRRLRDTQKQVMETFRAFFEAEKAEMEKYQKKQSKQTASNRKTTTYNKSTGSGLSDPRKNKVLSKAFQETEKYAHRGYGNFLNPLATFLSGLGAFKEGNYENAKIEFKRFYEALPENQYAQKYYVTALSRAGRRIPDNLAQVEPFSFSLANDAVFVIFANGVGPALKQVAIYMPVMTAWPVCEYFKAPYQFLEVSGGTQKIKTDVIADMDGILSQEYNERLPGIITRIVISTAIKEGMSYGAAYAAGQANEAAGIAVLLGSMIYRYMFNVADTRCWETLPKNFQLAQLPMPKDRKILISPDGDKNNVGNIVLTDDCQSAIIYVNAPSKRMMTYNVLEFK